MSDNKGMLNTLDAATFASTMGQAVWLMTMSKEHRDLPISSIEALIAPAILLKQFRLFSKGKQPVAFLIWDSVSDEVKARLDSGDKTLEMSDWRSGTHIVVIDRISPMNPKNIFVQKFMDSAAEAQAKTKENQND